jgi:hypothetical protein
VEQNDFEEANSGSAGPEMYRYQNIRYRIQTVRRLSLVSKRMNSVRISVLTFNTTLRPPLGLPAFLPLWFSNYSALCMPHLSHVSKLRILFQ